MKILSPYGCSKTFIRVIQSFHDGIAARICCGDGCSDLFSIGYRCVLVPILFTIFLAAVLKSMSEELGNLYFRTKSDKDLFNLRRPKAKNMTQEQLVKELTFADDSVLVMLKHQKDSD